MAVQVNAFEDVMVGNADGGYLKARLAIATDGRHGLMLQGPPDLFCTVENLPPQSFLLLRLGVAPHELLLGWQAGFNRLFLRSASSRLMCEPYDPHAPAAPDPPAVSVVEPLAAHTFGDLVGYRVDTSHAWFTAIELLEPYVDVMARLEEAEQLRARVEAEVTEEMRAALMRVGRRCAAREPAWSSPGAPNAAEEQPGGRTRGG